MKKKNYVYKVVSNGVCYNNLEAAAGDAFRTMTYQAGVYGSRLTNPLVIKVPGGYDVKAFTETGKVWTRHIDVFVPADHSKNKAVIHYLAARHSTFRYEYHHNDCSSNGYVNDDWDLFDEDEVQDDGNDDCDFFCDECADRDTCENSLADLNDDGELPEQED